MGFFDEIIGAAIKVATLPIAVIKDTSDTLEGYRPDNTKNQAKGAVKGVAKGVTDLMDGEL